MKGKILALATITAIGGVAVTGCATFGTGSARGSVGKVVSLINMGEAEPLTESSAVPFVFEGEVLLRPSDVKAVWRNLSINGFHLDKPEIMETVEIDETSYRVFADTFEMKTYFRKYVPTGSTLSKVESGGKEYFLLLGKVSEGYPEILGITGF